MTTIKQLANELYKIVEREKEVFITPVSRLFVKKFKVDPNQVNTAIIMPVSLNKINVSGTADMSYMSLKED